MNGYDMMLQYGGLAGYSESLKGVTINEVPIG